MVPKEAIRRGVVLGRIKLRKATRREKVMSLRELRTEYDRLARKLLGISGDEFARRARAGDLPESPAVDHLKFLLGAVQKS